MIYKHQYFTINTDTQEVFNKYGEDIKLTGYPYHFLKYLCLRKGGKVNISDIELIFDVTGNKTFNHNNVRQYINTIKNKLNRNIVKYDHEFYSIDGPVTESDGLDLIQPDETDTNKPAPTAEVKKNEPKKQQKKSKKIIWALIVVGVLIFVAAIGTGGYFAYKKVKEIYSPRPQAEMILIPAGEFTMGSTEAQIQEAFKVCEEGNYCQLENYQAEYPSHTANVKDFYIDKKEVTNADYQLFLEGTSNTNNDEVVSGFANDSNFNLALQPVVGVYYSDAAAYCKWRSARLPTEAEWEKAARSADGRFYPWGNVWEPAKLNHGQGGADGYDASDGFQYTAPVGATSQDISSYGVLNMAGNVQEWTSSEYVPYPGNDKFNNKGFNKGSIVVRGGAYTYGVSDCRVTRRFGSNPEDYYEDTGFRCAKDK